MITKQCRICDDNFEAKTEKRELCNRCQRSPTKAVERLERQIYRSKVRLGETFEKRYFEGVCETCNTKFVRFGNKSRYCSRECNNTAIAENAKCTVCNTLLFPLGITTTIGGVCSEECREKKRWIKARENKRVSRCLECKKEFIVTYRSTELCSKECEEIRDSKNKHRKMLKIGDVIEKEQCKCLVCEKDFEKMPKGHPTCSIKCKNTYERLVKQKKEEAEKERVLELILNNKATDEMIKAAHLCVGCKTSQAKCELFKSKFKQVPENSLVKEVKGSKIVIKCEQFKN